MEGVPGTPSSFVGNLGAWVLLWLSYSIEVNLGSVELEYTLRGAMPRVTLSPLASPSAVLSRQTDQA